MRPCSCLLYTSLLTVHPYRAAVEQELQRVKELGFNLLRKHAKIEPQRWYYHCDRLRCV